MAVPPYNGGLFTTDRAVSVAGAELARIRLPNELFQLALRDLLLTDLEPVDFRSLGVREFGTIYEGLLESELSVGITVTCPPFPKLQSFARGPQGAAGRTKMVKTGLSP
ncbi:MAG TPA: hypothetical protein VFE63_10580 [Roseiarcus sp.]|nr:hypothetical protein [Roseiarcus sp.]